MLVQYCGSWRACWCSTRLSRKIKAQSPHELAKTALLAETALQPQDLGSWMKMTATLTHGTRLDKRPLLAEQQATYGVQLSNRTLVTSACDEQAASLHGTPADG